MDLLKASYREVTGHALPSGLSYHQAELELRKATMSAWQQEAREEGGGAEGGRVRAPSLWATVVRESGADSSAPAGSVEGAAAKSDAKGAPTAGGTAGGKAGGKATAGSSAIGNIAAIAAGEFDDDDDDDFDEAQRPAAEVKRMQTGKEVFRGAGLGSGASPKVFEGWLTKIPPSRAPFGQFGKKERRRWFVLHENGELRYTPLRTSLGHSLDLSTSL